MKIFIIIVLTFLCFPKESSSIVVRDDVSDSQFRDKHRPEYLIDMPHEGHGVLIKSNWILTVAHEIFYDYTGKSINVSGVQYEIEKIIIHPKYQKIPKTLFKGSSLPLMAFNLKNDDLALLKLKKPVKTTTPIALYSLSNEQGKSIEIFGNGATGNGLTGQILETKNDKILRYCKNTILGANGNWLIYKFDTPSSAVALEGMHGSGDSGGPSVIYLGNTPYLAGLSAWQYIEGEMGDLTEGLYGTVAYQVRVSKYTNWINETISNN